MAPMRHLEYCEQPTPEDIEAQLEDKCISWAKTAYLGHNDLEDAARYFVSEMDYLSLLPDGATGAVNYAIALMRYFSKPIDAPDITRWEPSRSVETPGMLVDAAQSYFIRHGFIEPELMWKNNDANAARLLLRFRANNQKAQHALMPLLSTSDLRNIRTELAFKSLDDESSEAERMRVMKQLARNRAFKCAPSGYRDAGITLAEDVGLEDKYERAYEMLCEAFDCGSLSDLQGITTGMLLDGTLAHKNLLKQHDVKVKKRTIATSMTRAGQEDFALQFEHASFGKNLQLTLCDYLDAHIVGPRRARTQN